MMANVHLFTTQCNACQGMKLIIMKFFNSTYCTLYHFILARALPKAQKVCWLPRQQLALFRFLPGMVEKHGWTTGQTLGRSIEVDLSARVHAVDVSGRQKVITVKYHPVPTLGLTKGGGGGLKNA